MKSTYEIKEEMEKKFGKDFIKKMKSLKVEFEEYQKQLDEAKTFEEKVNDKHEEFRKTFVRIPDDYNIYPSEMCGQHLYVFARECIELGLSKDEEDKLYIQKQLECLDELEGDAHTLLEQIKYYRKEVNKENGK